MTIQVLCESKTGILEKYLLWIANSMHTFLKLPRIVLDHKLN